MKRVLTVPLGFLLVWGCSGNGNVVVKDNGLTDGVLPTADLLPLTDLTPGADSGTEDPLDVMPWVEDIPGEVDPACEAGSGCFLDPCQGPDDCLSGLCFDHLGDAACSTTCVEECPGGWLCQQIGSGPDMSFACVSPFTHLCRPCHTSADCESATGVEDVCLDYGTAGSFCGAPCQAGQCPAGYTCQDATTTEGATLKQCVSNAGVCSCAQKSVLLGLTTPCASQNEFGQCAGVRTCTESGLTACDAPVATAEVCNGVDDDCNGSTDDVGCDDDNPCTKDTCDPESGCQHEPLTGTECGDGDVCTLADHCQDGVCLGTAINCDDGNICTTANCDPTGGCLYAFNKSDCDDDDPCTINDTCTQGTCKGFDIQCECQKDSDCQALEDGDICNGTLACNTSKVPFTCAIKAGSVISCPPASGPDAACLKPSCHPISGECSLEPTNDGLACHDGDSCSMGDACQQGVCVGALPVNCNDGNPCTDDSCDAVNGCVHTANSLPCNDNNACTTNDVCSNGACQASGQLLCDDGNPCTTDTCDSSAGCLHAPSDGACDDGNACTLVDQCHQGLCQGGLAPNCDDSNVCTTDSCDPATGCVHGLNQAPCDDGDVCTIGDHCLLGECLGQGTLLCDDKNPCTDDACLPASGCSFTPNQVACNDNNPCTTGDQCNNGQCATTGWLDCNDDNICTTDYCQPPNGCVNEANLNPCDDGNACTIADTCSQGTCQPGAPLVCNDNDNCTTDSCGPEGNCLHVAIAPCCGNGQKEDGEACDDGNDIDDDFCSNNCQANQPVVPGFSGQLGPVFSGWIQCEGYLDKPGGDDIPKEWGNDCTAAQYNKMKMVCGSSLQSYRYLDINKNVFKDGLTAYSQTGLIYGANYSGYENIIYADGNHPHNSSSWWGGPTGCDENAKNTTVNNSCSWEASNCFGQGISGNRYLWLYVAP